MVLKSSFKNFLLYFPLVVPLLFTACSKADEDDEDPKVTAEEDLYINEAYASDGTDWLEIYSKNSSAKDLGGYKIYDDVDNKYTLPGGTTIQAGGFLIIYCDDGATGLHTNFKLSSSGETVYLENKEGEVVDKMQFPAMLDGQSFARFPDGVGTPVISGNPTQGTSNGTTSAPAISSVTRNPLVPALDDDVTVRAELTANTQISEITLFYRANGGVFTAVEMILNAGAYVGTIPALNAVGTVEYYVEAENTTGGSSVSPYEAPDKNYKYLLNTDPLPQLFINEFMASNTTCCPDTDSGDEEFDDWIEIYNAGSESVNIADMYLSDDLNNPFNSKIGDSNPAMTTIQPGEFLRVWADGSKSQGPLHLDFSLGTDGEDIGLYYIDGRKIDEYTFGVQVENVSFGRTTNGGEAWSSFDTPTPGASNE